MTSTNHMIKEVTEVIPTKNITIATGTYVTSTNHMIKEVTEVSISQRLEKQKIRTTLTYKQ